MYKVGDKVVVIHNKIDIPDYKKYIGKVSEILVDENNPDDPCYGNSVILAYDDASLKDPRAFSLKEIIPADIYNSPLYKALKEE